MAQAATPATPAPAAETQPKEAPKTENLLAAAQEAHEAADAEEAEQAAKPKEPAKAAQPKETEPEEGEETEVVEPAEDEVDPKVAAKFQGKDGKLDVKKLVKSYLEAEQKISEGGKATPEVQRAIALQRDIGYLMQSDPEFKDALVKADKKAREKLGKGGSPERGSMTPAEVQREAIRLREAGKTDEALSLLIDNHPAVQEAKQVAAKVGQREQKEQAAATEKEYSELTEKFGVPDDKLMDSMTATYQQGFQGTMEECRAVALVKLGRVKLRTKKTEPEKPAPSRSRRPESRVADIPEEVDGHSQEELDALDRMIEARGGLVKQEK